MSWRCPRFDRWPADPRLMRLAERFVGPSQPFRATLFDKSASANWLVVWRSGPALPMRAQVDAAGWGPWSTKAGTVYAHAPAAALARVVALRVSLNPSTGANGPLRVLPRTHVDGLLDDVAVERLAREVPPVACTVGAGGVVAMRPLLLHASSKSTSDARRRALHIECASAAGFGPGLDLAVGSRIRRARDPGCATCSRSAVPLLACHGEVGCPFAFVSVSGTAAALFAVTPVAGQSVARVTVGHNGAQPDGSHGVGVVSSATVGSSRSCHRRRTWSPAIRTAGRPTSSSAISRPLTTIMLASLASDGLQRSGHSGALCNGGINITTQEHDISNDGRFVVFMSRAALCCTNTGECTIPPTWPQPTVRTSTCVTGRPTRRCASASQLVAPTRTDRASVPASAATAGSSCSVVRDQPGGRPDRHLPRRSEHRHAVPRGSRAVAVNQRQRRAHRLPVDVESARGETGSGRCQPFPGDTQIVVCFRPFIFDRVLGETRRVPMPAIATEVYSPAVRRCPTPSASRRARSSHRPTASAWPSASARVRRCAGTAFRSSRPGLDL